jgi:hypothetical protein
LPLSINPYSVKKMKFTIPSANFTHFIPSTPTEVEAWLARIQTASGSISESHTDAVSSFVIGAKQDGWFSKILGLNPFAGNNKAAGLVPLIGAANWTDAEDNVAYGTTGFTFENNESIETGLAPNALFSSNTNIGIHSYQMGITGAGFAIDISAGGNLELNSRATGGVIQARACRGSFSATAANSGLLSVITNASQSILYRNGVSIGTDASALVALPSTPILIGQRPGLATGYATSTIAAIAFTQELTAGEMAQFSARVATLMAGLGR